MTSQNGLCIGKCIYRLTFEYNKKSFHISLTPHASVQNNANALHSRINHFSFPYTGPHSSLNMIWHNQESSQSHDSRIIWWAMPLAHNEHTIRPTSALRTPHAPVPRDGGGVPKNEKVRTRPGRGPPDQDLAP